MNNKNMYDQLFSSMVLPVKPAVQATGARLDITDPGTVQMAEGFDGYVGGCMLAAAGMQPEQTQADSPQQPLHAEQD